MLNKIKAFICDDTGAVTVDWVVLTAALIGMGMIFLAPIALNTTSVTAELGNKIGDAPLGYGN
jgi:hypothetical protein